MTQNNASVVSYRHPMPENLVQMRQDLEKLKLQEINARKRYEKFKELKNKPKNNVNGHQNGNKKSESLNNHRSLSI